MITKAEALLSLRPGAKWSLDDDNLIWIDTIQSQPSEEEINDEIEKLQQEFNNKEYQRNRIKEYPSIGDQLDMLYHDIKSGNLNLGSWISAIETVKTNYPKPD